MLLTVLSGFIVSVLLVVTGKLIKGKSSLILSLLPLILFIYFLDKIPAIAAGKRPYYSYQWIPSMGINFDFFLDGLSLLFSLLITGIGSLIFIYASSYLKDHIHLDRFFGYLCMFMGSMLGLVLSDNVITLFIFWELTSISSFFLIGFNNDNADSRKSSLIALAITGGGGFLLMAGFILMGSISNSYSIQQLMQVSGELKDHSLYILIMILVIAGAFTKSAQFPFHFWLPGAMRAPTPVSAYLHSATMVKAGVYLLARFTPVLGDQIYWNNTLMIVGGITMLYAAFHSIIRTYLKSILAYSTISALGILVFLLGIGTPKALIAVAVFILVHALYKAGLFLVAGIIDHQTGIRDVTVLKGLRKLMLPVACAGLLAAISNAGIPLTFGFLGKELIYEATLASDYFPVALTIGIIVTNILLFYAGFLAGIKPFTGSLPEQFQKVHLPSILMWLPPLLLGIGGLFFGIFPAAVDNSLIQPVVLSMQNVTEKISLKIWHGFSLVLLLSAITLAIGLILYFIIKPSHKKEGFIAKFNFISPQNILSFTSKRFIQFSGWYTRTLQAGYLRIYILIILSFLICLLAYKLFTGVEIYLDKSQFSALTIYEVVVSAIMFMAILKTIFTSSRLTAVASMGVVGYCICLLFVFYSAPDLAMTQFTIETLTVVLFVLVLFKLPPFLRFTDTRVRIRDGLFALAFGSLISIIALEVLNEPINKEISRYYGDNAYLLAKGKNVVNVILVDFRGVDTLAEIIVLSIAAIGVYSLIKFKISYKKQ